MPTLSADFPPWPIRAGRPTIAIATRKVPNSSPPILPIGSGRDLRAQSILRVIIVPRQAGRLPHTRSPRKPASPVPLFEESA